MTLAVVRRRTFAGPVSTGDRITCCAADTLSPESCAGGSDAGHEILVVIGSPLFS
jgi:hypothetical protein